jgi:biopolymer transport protein ExbD
MLRIRRRQEELRVELTPMIDVIFLLLTFFIYSMVLLVRVDLVPMDLRTFASGEAAKPVAAATISIDLDGGLFLDREAISIEELLPRIQAIREQDPATTLYLAIADGAGRIDRAPLLQDLWDRLKSEQIPISLVGRPSSAAASPGPAGPSAP